MPIFNLYRNCSYYWAFGAYISWFINHPLYTPAPITRTIVLLTLGFACELANFKCAISLVDLTSLWQPCHVPRV